MHRLAEEASAAAAEHVALPKGFAEKNGEMGLQLEGDASGRSGRGSGNRVW